MERHWYNYRTTRKALLKSYSIAAFRILLSLHGSGVRLLVITNLASYELRSYEPAPVSLCLLAMFSGYEKQKLLGVARFI